MSDGYEERLQAAKNCYEDLQTYMAAGFTREEAMQYLCRTVVNVQSQQNYPPEVFEFWERQNAFATKALKELEDDF